MSNLSFNAKNRLWIRYPRLGISLNFIHSLQFNRSIIGGEFSTKGNNPILKIENFWYAILANISQLLRVKIGRGSLLSGEILP